jgi:hypothetical protein
VIDCPATAVPQVPLGAEAVGRVRALLGGAGLL